MSSYLRKKFQHTFGYGVSQNVKDEIPYAESDASDNNKDTEEIERSKVEIMRALVEKQDPSAKENLVDLAQSGHLSPMLRASLGSLSPTTDIKADRGLRFESHRNTYQKKIKHVREERVKDIIDYINGVDDQMIRRFLRARDLDIEKATTMFLKYLSWRKDFVPNGSISSSEIPNELAHNKVFMQGQDNIGRPIVVAFGGRHTQVNVDEFKRLVTYTLDKVCSRMPNEQEKFVAIGDLEGWGYANSDIRGYLAALSILQDCYPERLGKLFIVHVPYIFMTAWKAIYPFIDSKTKKKIIFVENKKLRSTLQRDIDDDQLPDIYGGKLQLVPIQDC